MEDDADELTVVPDVATMAAWDFYKGHHSQMRYMTSANMVFRDFDSLMKGLGLAFAEIAPEGPEELFPHWHKRREYLQNALNENLPMVAEYGMTRCVENFLSYVSEVLSDTLISKPSLLKSQEQVTYEEVLAHGSIDEFAAWAAERRISQLSFKGLEEIAGYIEKRLGLRIHGNDEHWKTLKRGVAIRNLVVHRRGIADERFARVVAGAKKNERYVFGLHDYLAVASSALRIVRDFDSKVAEKFSLTQIAKEQHSDWLR
ncbi:hypothetical protein OHB07_11460 [Streptomyces sp. NBC_00111]|uniref:hypothetical protein n=1 Tax=Streptomyces sp. NBC_00111 TaxID=2975655 RepID=UPI00325347E9